MLMALAQANLMSPWDVIEAALARRKPKRDQAWLAGQLEGISEQGLSNWKKRGVPRGRFEEVGEVLGLSYNQIAGKEPLPWERAESNWPFPDIDSSRFYNLTELQRGEIQGEVRKLIERFERRTAGSGESPNSQRLAS